MTKKGQISIAIDGPAAAGKSTVAKTIANKLSIIYIDTGAMYRAFTLKALNYQFDLEDEASLLELLEQTKITFIHNTDNQRVLLDDKDVTDRIRKDDVSNNVSIIA